MRDYDNIYLSALQLNGIYFMVFQVLDCLVANTDILANWISVSDYWYQSLSRNIIIMDTKLKYYTDNSTTIGLGEILVSVADESIQIYWYQQKYWPGTYISVVLVSAGPKSVHS